MENIKIDFAKLPSKSGTHAFIDGLLEWLFPSGNNSAVTINVLQTSLQQLLKPMQPKIGDSVEAVSAKFFEQVDNIFNRLVADAEFFLKADPAAETIEEVIAAYPGFYAIAVYRIANQLYRLNIPILPRLITEYAHTNTGIDIHPGATIGYPFFIDHGTGMVIGQTAVIGNRVKIYQGVTLGALAVKKEEQGAKRHPTIEDDVIIYAGSCILGGTTTVGHDSIIGGNVWLTESVLPYSIVYHKSEVHIRDKSELKEVIEFII